jgi:hypothetical protein
MTSPEPTIHTPPEIKTMWPASVIEIAIVAVAHIVIATSQARLHLSL